MPIAVITGSSSGIGQATAIRFAQCGYDVVLHAHRNVNGLQQTARRCLASAAPGIRVLCVTADIAAAAAAQQLVSTAFAWQSHVDVWVNNAGSDVLTGRARQQPFEDRLAALWHVDVLGTIRLSRAIAERMSGQTPPQLADGSSRLPTLINMSWDQAELGMEGEPGQLFGTTKAAVAAFSRSLALSHPKLRVNCVAPGWIQTAWGATDADDYWSRRATSEAILQRWGTAADVAQTITWLADPHSQFINAQTVAVNGGRRYYPPKQGGPD